MATDDGIVESRHCRGSLVRQMLMCVRGMVEPGGLLTSLWRVWSMRFEKGLTAVSSGSELDSLSLESANRGFGMLMT